MVNLAMLSNWHVHADGYAHDFLKLPYVNLKAVWDEDEERGRKWAADLGCEFISDLDALLARNDIQAVAVGTPTSMHREVICKAADAGKAVFTEKVLAATNAEAAEIKAAVERNNTPFLIALRRRTEQGVRLAKRLTDEGKIGEITHLRVRDAHDGSVAGWLPRAFYDEALCGGGAMMDLGAHPMYLSAYFMGLPRSVYSMFTDFAHNGADDNCVTVMEYENGALATAETAFVSCQCPFSLEIDGTKGSISVRSDVGGVRLSNQENDNRLIDASEEEEMPQPPEIFADALENGKPMPFGIDAAAELTRLMDAAYRSYKSGKRETL